MTKININSVDQTEVFHSLLDAMNYEGYAEQISSENPKLYEFEREQFQQCYCEPVVTYKRWN